MTLNRYAARRDANDGDLCAFAERLGWYMYRTKLPDDYLAGFRGRWYVVGIKTAKGTPTAAQIKFQREASERALPVLIWRTQDDVLKASGAQVTA